MVVYFNASFLLVGWHIDLYFEFCFQHFKGKMVLQGLEADQQRVRSLLTEAITMLCRNGLSYQVELCVEGLLGITLDKNHVMLVNINQVVKHPSIQTAEQTTQKNTTHEPPKKVQTDPSNSHYAGESRIQSRPLTPMQPHRNPLRRGHGRRRALDSLRLKRAVSNVSAAEKSPDVYQSTVTTGQSHRLPHVTPSSDIGYEPMEQIDDDSASPSSSPSYSAKLDIKEEPLDDDRQNVTGVYQQTGPGRSGHFNQKLEVTTDETSDHQAAAELCLGGTEEVAAALSPHNDNSVSHDWDPTTLRGNTPMVCTH